MNSSVLEKKKADLEMGKTEPTDAGRRGSQTIGKGGDHG